MQSTHLLWRTNSHTYRGSTWPYWMTFALVLVVNELNSQCKHRIPKWHVEGSLYSKCRDKTLTQTYPHPIELKCLKCGNVPSCLVCILFAAFFSLFTIFNPFSMHSQITPSQYIALSLLSFLTAFCLTNTCTLQFSMKRDYSFSALLSYKNTPWFTSPFPFVFFVFSSVQFPLFKCSFKSPMLEHYPTWGVIPVSTQLSP